MVFIEGHCPHCNEKRGFNLFAVSEYTSKKNTNILEKENKNPPARSLQTLITNARFYACGICCHCYSPVIIDIEIPDQFLFTLRDCIKTHERLYDGPTPKVLNMYPKPIPPYCHPSLPLAIQKGFCDIQVMLKQGLSPSLVITGCRSVLEISVNELGAEGTTLQHKINNLKEKSIVNGVLADWAHQIRLEGNSAVHKMEGTQEEAEELVEFTKLFLQYTFEFPSRVNAIRNKKIS